MGNFQLESVGGGALDAPFLILMLFWAAGGGGPYIYKENVGIFL